MSQENQNNTVTQLITKIERRELGKKIRWVLIFFSSFYDADNYFYNFFGIRKNMAYEINN